MKKELLRCVDKIPAYCHQLMFTSRSLAVGQSACCRKVRFARQVEIIKCFPNMTAKQWNMLPEEVRDKAGTKDFIKRIRNLDF